MEKSKMQSRNRMTAQQLIISQNSELEFIENPNTGKLFFMCGSIKGYVSPAVAAKQDTITIEEMQFAECAVEGSNDWVPCLMMVGDSKKNVKRSFGSDLLR